MSTYVDPTPTAREYAAALSAQRCVTVHGPEYTRWYRLETWKYRAEARVLREHPGVSLDELVRRGLLGDDVLADDAARRSSVAYAQTQGQWWA